MRSFLPRTKSIEEGQVYYFPKGSAFSVCWDGFPFAESVDESGKTIYRHDQSARPKRNSSGTPLSMWTRIEFQPKDPFLLVKLIRVEPIPENLGRLSVAMKLIMADGRIGWVLMWEDFLETMVQWIE